MPDQANCMKIAREGRNKQRERERDKNSQGINQENATERLENRGKIQRERVLRFGVLQTTPS
jgi:hypothetical protein